MTGRCRMDGEYDGDVWRRGAGLLGALHCQLTKRLLTEPRPEPDAPIGDCHIGRAAMLMAADADRFQRPDGGDPVLCHSRAGDGFGWNAVRNELCKGWLRGMWYSAKVLFLCRCSVPQISRNRTHHPFMFYKQFSLDKTFSHINDVFMLNSLRIADVTLSKHEVEMLLARKFGVLITSSAPYVVGSQNHTSPGQRITPPQVIASRRQVSASRRRVSASRRQVRLWEL